MRHRQSGLKEFTEPVEIAPEYFLIPDYLKDDVGIDPLYAGVNAPQNKWIDLTFNLATESARSGGGPFGAVILQIDSQSGQALRYWSASNGVTQKSDPTAHAEITVIRSACRSLGVFHLDKIIKTESNLPQQGECSHCVIFSSCEPCPMCYGAISWARIPVMFFGATRFDASASGVNFSDANIYEELQKPYAHRKIKTYFCPGDKVTESFDHWKKNPGIHY